MRVKLAGTTDFYEDEARCKCGCGLILLHPGMAEALQEARTEFGRPMNPLSWCRCVAHNARPAAEGGAGGHPHSLHVGDFPFHADKGQRGTLGVDLAAADGRYRGDLFALLWKRGWSIGWNAKRLFLHGDLRILIGMPQQSFDY